MPSLVSHDFHSEEKIGDTICVAEPGGFIPAGPYLDFDPPFPSPATRESQCSPTPSEFSTSSFPDLLRSGLQAERARATRAEKLVRKLESELRSQKDTTRVMRQRLNSFAAENKKIRDEAEGNRREWEEAEEALALQLDKALDDLDEARNDAVHRLGFDAQMLRKQQSKIDEERADWELECQRLNAKYSQELTRANALSLALEAEKRRKRGVAVKRTSHGQRDDARRPATPITPITPVGRQLSPELDTGPTPRTGPGLAARAPVAIMMPPPPRTQSAKKERTKAKPHSSQVKVKSKRKGVSGSILKDRFSVPKSVTSEYRPSSRATPVLTGKRVTRGGAPKNYRVPTPSEFSFSGAG